MDGNEHMEGQQPQPNMYRLGQACPFGNGNFYANGTRWIQKMEDRLKLVETQLEQHITTLTSIEKKINAFIGGVSIIVGGTSFIFLVLRMISLFKEFIHE